MEYTQYMKRLSMKLLRKLVPQYLLEIKEGISEKDLEKAHKRIEDFLAYAEGDLKKPL